MARFEIVGLNDCPWYAKSEKLADEIVALNPSIDFHKEMLDRFHWGDFCDRMKRQRGWDIKRSPVIYEVLVELDGKAFLIGDANDFCEFAAMYFDIYYDPTSVALQAMAMGNKTRFGRGFEGQDRGSAAIFNVAIVNAPIKMLELLLTQLISPVSMVPAGMLLNITIYDEKTEPRNLSGILMEIFDFASPILFKATISSTLSVCLYQCKLFILAEDFSRGPTEEPNAWIGRVEQKVTTIIGAFNDRRAKAKDCRIIVGGDGPQCYIAEMLRKSISLGKSGPGRIVASGQHIAQRAKCELSKIGNVPAGCIARIHAWGWPGDTGAYIEVHDAVLRGAEVSIQGPGVEIPLTEVATHSDFIFMKFSKEFLRLQKKYLNHTVSQPRRYMVLADSILNTVHIWLASEPIVSVNVNEEGKSRPSSINFLGRSGVSGDAVVTLPSGIPLPVLNVGVPCTNGSTFPEGTFMVQPAVCVNGHWQALGIISDKTNAKVVMEVNKLWMEREKLIYRDQKIRGLFEDFDSLTKQVGDWTSVTEQEAREPTYSSNSTREIPGEMSDFFNTSTSGAE